MLTSDKNPRYAFNFHNRFARQSRNHCRTRRPPQLPAECEWKRHYRMRARVTKRQRKEITFRMNWRETLLLQCCRQRLVGDVSIVHRYFIYPLKRYFGSLLGFFFAHSRFRWIQEQILTLANSNAAFILRSMCSECPITRSVRHPLRVHCSMFMFNLRLFALTNDGLRADMRMCVIHWKACTELSKQELKNSITNWSIYTMRK